MSQADLISGVKNRENTVSAIKLYMIESYTSVSELQSWK